jgi:inner membrane protein
LAGLLVADVTVTLAQRRGGAREPAFRDAVFALAVLANNFPDLDFLYSGITGGKLGYLLHHRGHTHTLALALPQALVCYALVTGSLWLRRRRLGKTEHLILLAVAALGPVLHVFMDFCNNYGVHPFWPFDNRWYYGDLVFVIEPWLLVLLLCSNLAAVRTPVSKGLLLAALAVLLVLAWVLPLIQPLVAFALTLTAALGVWQLHAASARTRITTGVLGVGTVLVVLLGARQQVLALVRADLAPSSDVSTLAVSTSPTPGNPLCWSVLGVQRAGSTYRIRQAIAAPFPALADVSECRLVGVERTAPLSPPQEKLAADPTRVRWGAEFRAPVHELRALYRDRCEARALLRFTRAPFWTQSDADLTVLGDLRFDREAEQGFTELELDPNAPCPKHIPPWEPPLAGLLDGG